MQTHVFASPAQEQVIHGDTMNKVNLFLVTPLLFASIDAMPQEEIIEEIVVQNAIADPDWFIDYMDLLDDYTELCDLDDQELSETERYVCDKLTSVINQETEKKIALSQHTVAVFHRQGIATNIVLALVVFIVISGIMLAAYQLWVAADQGAPQGNAELEASAAKIRITSSSVGLVVLAMSLLFLYLYIKEIYHISTISIS